jgi:hypothetical protein
LVFSSPFRPCGAYNYFTNKVEAFDVEMDNSSMELINYFILRRGGSKK